MAKNRPLKGVDYDLPTGITFNREDDNCVQLLLSERAIGLAGTSSLNMQADAAAFEAWALILHVNSGIKTIRLGLQSGFSHPLPRLTDPPLLKTQPGHYNRFLYRVMKFRQQYKSWFEIADENLDEAIGKFKQALDKGRFCNNRPMSTAKSDPSNLESRVEAVFADSEDDEPKVGPNLLRELTSAYNIIAGRIFRQFPVGLFSERKLEENGVFTGGHSAIDLWSLSQGTDPEIVVYELKAGNQMAGIITELMFYANYMYDMYVEKGNSFQPEKPGANNFRGYHDLYAAQNSLTGVSAFMLTDKLHPQITDEVLAAMNSNDPSRKIRYGRIDYDSDIVVKKIS